MRIVRGILRGLVSAGLFVKARHAATSGILFCLEEPPAPSATPQSTTPTRAAGVRLGWWGWEGLIVCWWVVVRVEC